MKSEEVAYANDSIIFQHQQQQQQNLMYTTAKSDQQQQNLMYTTGGDLSDAPLPPLPPSGGH